MDFLQIPQENTTKVDSNELDIVEFNSNIEIKVETINEEMLMDLPLSTENDDTQNEGDPLKICEADLKKEIKVEPKLNEEEIISEENGVEGVNKYLFCNLCGKFSEVVSDVFRRQLGTFSDSCYKTLRHKLYTEWTIKVYCLYESCMSCVKAFSNSVDFINRDCLCENLFYCNVCYVTFDKKQDIVWHVKTCIDHLKNQVSNDKHVGENEKKKLNCHYCRKVFKNISSLNFHLQSPTHVVVYMCNFCEKAFSSLSNLNNHKCLHSGRTPFICNVCKKIFSSSGNLKRHKLTHAGEKPFACDVCKTSFSRNDDLKRHRLLLHAGEKLFRCDVCRRTFSRNGNLKQHRLTHTGEKIFGCDICKKTFFRNGHLKQHRLTHTGMKPFGCDVCKKTFSRNGDLKQHRLIHTGGKPFN